MLTFDWFGFSRAAFARSLSQHQWPAKTKKGSCSTRSWWPNCVASTPPLRKTGHVSWDTFLVSQSWAIGHRVRSVREITAFIMSLMPPCVSDLKLKVCTSIFECWTFDMEMCPNAYFRGYVRKLLAVEVSDLSLRRPWLQCSSSDRSTGRQLRFLRA